jgi:hypothetical protein
MSILYHQPLCLFPRLCGGSPNQGAERETQMYNQLLRFRRYMLVLGRTLIGGLILMTEKF